MQITINNTTFKPRSEMTIDEAIFKAIKKVYGVGGRFMQNSGLPKGYGSFLSESTTANVLGTGTIEIA